MKKALYWQLTHDCAGFPVLVSWSNYHIRLTSNSMGGSKMQAIVYDEHFTPVTDNVSIPYAKRLARKLTRREN